jgi:hypothetical protein
VHVRPRPPINGEAAAWSTLDNALTQLPSDATLDGIAGAGGGGGGGGVGATSSIDQRPHRYNHVYDPSTTTGQVYHNSGRHVVASVL